MKILIDARMYGLENSGIGRYLINLIEEYKNYKADENIILLLRKKYSDILDLPDKWQKVEADYPHYSFSEQIFIPGIINKLKPDLVHFPHLNIPLFWKGKFVVTVHDLTMQHQKSDATSLPLPLYYLKRFPFLIDSKKAVTKSSLIIVPATTIKKDILKYYKGIREEKIRVIYEGFRSNNSKINSDTEAILHKYKLVKPYFFYVGNAYPHKNLHSAIKAVVYLNKHLGQKAIFAIGGSRNVFTDKLNREITVQNASGFVRMLGFVEEKHLSVLYKESAGLIYPSLSEGYGLQGIEAMSSGTLVLASDIPVFKEVYDDYAFYFKPKDIPSIATAMKYVLNLDPDLRRKFILKSQHFIKKYSWAKMARETFETYESCIGL